ncbi:hypothetical protein MMC29_003383 [Sticta canariensis]|nr:hypothetical protein [Sticta canariensis]
MSAQSIDVFVLDFNVATGTTDKPRLNNDPSNTSFDLFINENIRTLSTNSVGNGDDVEGFLYVPDLRPSDPCANLSANYISQNVTRKANLPPGPYPLVALAPWVTPNCTISYLAAAHDASAFIFYLTDDRTGKPPPVNDETWKLNDGGSWKSENRFPVYAVPSNFGRIMMHQLAVYSETPTNGSHGDLLTAAHSSNNYSRLYTTITTNTRNDLPSLWAFLLIVLGVVLFLVGITSLSMHCIQRRNRRALHRRVASGEVDLEALGIKRLTVPQEALDKLAMFIYVASEKPPIDAQRSEPPAKTTDISCVRLSSPEPDSTRRSVSEPNCIVQSGSANQSVLPPLPLPSSSPAHRQPTYSQPSCTICLDEFESHCTVVRELPCQHIYHPDCIDAFLTKSSSRCPVCKRPVLPTGYCPENITSAMVRRERQIRRRQQRDLSSVVEGQLGRNGGNVDIIRRPVAVGRRMASYQRQFGRSTRISYSGNRPSSAPTSLTTVEMSDRTSNNPSAPTESSSHPIFGLSERRRRAKRAVGQDVKIQLAYAPTPHSYVPNPTLSATINLDEEVKLSNSAGERDLFDSLAEIYSIIITLDGLEKAYIKDSVLEVEYTEICSRLLKQYKSTLNDDNVMREFVDLDTFKAEWNIECPRATERIRVNLPATIVDPSTAHVNSSNAVVQSGSVASGSQILLATENFITFLDALKLNMLSKDSLHPLLSEVIQSVNQVTNADFDNRSKIINWLIRLNGMRATEELGEDEARELAFDMDGAEICACVNPNSSIPRNALSQDYILYPETHITVIDGRECITKLIGPSVQYKNASKKPTYALYLKFPVMNRGRGYQVWT